MCPKQHLNPVHHVTKAGFTPAAWCVGCKCGMCSFFITARRFSTILSFAVVPIFLVGGRCRGSGPQQNTQLKLNWTVFYLYPKQGFLCFSINWEQNNKKLKLVHEKIENRGEREARMKFTEITMDALGCRVCHLATIKLVMSHATSLAGNAGELSW